MRGGEGSSRIGGCGRGVRVRGQGGWGSRRDARLVKCGGWTVVAASSEMRGVGVLSVQSCECLYSVDVRQHACAYGVRVGVYEGLGDGTRLHTGSDVGLPPCLCPPPTRPPQLPSTPSSTCIRFSVLAVAISLTTRSHPWIANWFCIDERRPAPVKSTSAWGGVRAKRCTDPSHCRDPKRHVAVSQSERHTWK